MKPKLNNEILRRLVGDGMTPLAIAQRYGCSRQAVSKRLRQMGLTDAQAALGESERFARETMCAMAALGFSVKRVKRLYDSCDRWLQDPRDSERYLIDPRAGEITVVWEEVERGPRGGIKRHRRVARLSVLLDMVQGVVGEHPFIEVKVADPRELVLKTAAELRKVVDTAIKLAETLVNVQRLEALHDALMETLERQDPKVAREIADAIHRRLVHRTALPGDTEAQQQ